MSLTLYDNALANAPIRVRIVLLLKGIAFERVAVEFDYAQVLEDTKSYRALNPQAMVPVIADGDFVLWQSIAIAEYLDEKYPTPPLLPADLQSRARVRCLAAMVACDAQPIVNYRVRERLRHEFGLSEAQVLAWVRQWLDDALKQYERAVSGDAPSGRFSHGDTPTLADVYLFPLVLHARRFAVPLDAYPTIVRIFAECMAIPAFRDAI